MGATGRVRHTHGGAATNTHHRTALKRAQVCTRWASAVFGLRHDDLDDTHGHDRLDVTSTSAQYMPAQTWSGARDGYVFTCGALGLGYYLEGCTGLTDNAWDSALGERGVDEEVIAKLDQALLSSEVVIGVVKQSVAVLEQQRHQLRRRRTLAEPAGVERDDQLDQLDRTVLRAEKREHQLAQGAEEDADEDVDVCQAGRCLYCGANGVRHQWNTCVFKSALSIDQCIELVYEKDMSKNELRSLRESGFEIASYNQFMSCAASSLRWPDKDTYQDVPGHGDSVVGDVTKLVKWHMGLPAVRRAMQDEKDDERTDGGVTFCISFDGSNFLEVMVARNANLRASTGDVHAIMPISLMRIGETRGELLRMLRMHQLPKMYINA